MEIGAGTNPIFSGIQSIGLERLLKRRTMCVGGVSMSRELTN